MREESAKKNSYGKSPNGRTNINMEGQRRNAGDEGETSESVGVPDVIVCHKASSCVAACSSAHHHFCHLQFIHVGASHCHRLHPVQHSWHEQSSCGPFPSRVVILSCRIGRMASFSSYSIHNVPSCLLRYSYHHHSAGCFPYI